MLFILGANWISAIKARTMGQEFFVDFEVIFVVCVSVVLVLGYLFYVRYPYDKELTKEDETK